MTLLARLWNAFSPRFRAELAPDAAFVVIGDIHGRLDLLEKMIEKLADKLGSDVTLVFVGDYVDRGEDAAGVLSRLQILQAGLWPGKVVCLRGNHEAMLLDFLDGPELEGPFWLAHGGMQTLASFGILPPSHSATARDLCLARDRLIDALGPDRLEFLRSLALTYESGNVLVSHAGANPHSPVHAQDEKHLLWGHPDFLNTDRKDGIWVVHGHTIFDMAQVKNGRISVDTGAYATNILSAAHIDRQICRFFSVNP